MTSSNEDDNAISRVIPDSISSERFPLGPKATLSDFFAFVARSVLGATPMVGPFFTELVGIVIPNKRIERIEKFATILNEQLYKLGNDFDELKKRIETDEELIDLIEEGFRQSTRSLSDERKGYIASIIANSLSVDAIKAQESRHLLRILGELSDIEIIWLRYYLVTSMNGDKDFREKHVELTKPISVVASSPQSQRDKAALQKSYKEHLSQVGLLDKRYGSQLDTRLGGLKLEGYSITSMGKLLLREIGLVTEDSKV